MLKRTPSSAVVSRGIACAFAASLLVGCQESKEVKQAHAAVNDYFNGDFSGAIHKLQPLANNTDENYVLNNLRARLGGAGYVRS